MPDDTRRLFPETQAGSMYVGYVDILGFGNRVLNEFDQVVGIYEDVCSTSKFAESIRRDVTVRVYSDAFLLTCPHLGASIAATQALCMSALLHDCLARGGLAYGKHLESHRDGNLFVVSQALVRAVGVEKAIGHPCVGIDDSVLIPDSWWDPTLPNLKRGVLCWDGLNFVNPFNEGWGHSAMTRVAIMSVERPGHDDKYEWFLRLYEAVLARAPLIPASASA